MKIRKNAKKRKISAPPGNRTRGVRMGILHVTTTLAALEEFDQTATLVCAIQKINIVTFNVIYNPIEVFNINSYVVCVIN